MKLQKKTSTVADSDRARDIYVKAAEIFEQQGFDATSMSDIAAAVDLTKAGLYYYIPSKDELLLAIMNYAMDRLEETVIEPARDQLDPELRLRAIITLHGRLLTEGNKAITILTDEIRGLRPKHRRKILDRKRAYFDFVRETLDELRRVGKLRPIDTTVATFGLFGMLLWLPRWYRPGGALSSDEIIAEITQMVTGGLLAGEAERS